MPGKAKSNAHALRIKRLRGQRLSADQSIADLNAGFDESQALSSSQKIELDQIRARAVDLEALLKTRNREYDQLVRENIALADRAAAADANAETLTAILAEIRRLRSQADTIASRPNTSPISLAEPLPSPAATNTKPSPARRLARRLKRVLTRRPTTDAELQGRFDIILDSRLFDADWYCARYADVEPGVNTALAHYLAHGAREGRSPHPLFDVEWYVAQGGHSDSPEEQTHVEHYLKTGAQQGMSPHPLFDAQWYMDKNPDVAKSGTPALVHFLRSGWKEGRAPNKFFNPEYYLKQAPALAKGETDPLSHYLADPAGLELDPNPHFQSAWYLSTNADVRESGLNPLLHYVQTGRSEGRLPAAESRSKRNAAHSQRSPLRTMALPDLFDLKAEAPQSDTAIILQLATRADASCAGAWLASLSCAFDLILLCPSHIEAEIDEFFGRYRTSVTGKRFAVLICHETAASGVMFAHLAQGGVLAGYRQVGWVPGAEGLPRPYAPFDPSAAFAQDPDCGLLAYTTLSPANLLDQPAIANLCNRFNARTNLDAPIPEDIVIPDGPCLWIKGLLLSALAAARITPVEVLVEAHDGNLHQRVGGRQILSLILSTAASHASLRIHSISN